MSNYISGVLKLSSERVRRASAHLRVFRFPGISEANDIGAFTPVKLTETQCFLKSRRRDGRVGGGGGDKDGAKETRAAVMSFLCLAFP